MNQEKKHPSLERANSRRKQVLDAAACCFSRHGFHGASMAEISKTAGMSAGHIYNYFDSKDAIIAAFVEQNMERVSNIMHDLAQREDPLQAMIDDVEERVQECLDPGIWAVPLEIHSEASRNPKIAATMQAADKRSRGQLFAIVTAAREKRGLPAGEDLVEGRINAMIAMYQGLAVRHVHNPGVLNPGLVEGIRTAMRALMLGE